MELRKVYKPMEAVAMMGILCAKSSANRYIKHMQNDGLIKSSYKINGRWHVTEEDINYIRERIMNGSYAPYAIFKKAA